MREYEGMVKRVSAERAGSPHVLLVVCSVGRAVYKEGRTAENVIGEVVAAVDEEGGPVYRYHLRPS
jgi:hypothetical protein